MKLITSNRSGGGKELLFNALSITKPKNGPKLKAETGANDIDVEAFFAEIENYKAEFAFNLISAIEDKRKVAEKDNRLPNRLDVPNYILQAFNFIRG